MLNKVILNEKTVEQNEETAPFYSEIFSLPTGRYAARIRQLIAQEIFPATPSAIAQEEQEAIDLLRALNQSRRRDGAEPLV